MYLFSLKDCELHKHRDCVLFLFFLNGMLFSFLFKLILLIYLLILVAMGLYHCTQAFSSCTETGLLFLVVQRLLIAVASFFAEHGL